MSLSIVQMAPIARTIVEQILDVKPGEKVCIFTDTQCPQSITQLLAANSCAVGAETVIVTITPREVGGVDPPASAAAAINAADVIIAQASYAIIHTETIRGALRRSARLCEMWGFNEDMMVRGGATADYVEIRELSYRLADILTSGKEARLTTPDGTDITLPLQDRQCHVLGALADKPGSFCAFPDGEAAISPVEGGAKGILVNPFCLEKAEFGFIKEGLSLTIDNGKVVGIDGGALAKQLNDFLEQLGESARNIAELGIGTNRKARLGVTMRETKKSWGTAHIALGDSGSLGGKVNSPLHMDMIFREPTLVVDGQTLLEGGQVSI
ncbi:aminopeptidase [Chloroflexota bacterium]